MTQDTTDSLSLQVTDPSRLDRVCDGPENPFGWWNEILTDSLTMESVQSLEGLGCFGDIVYDGTISEADAPQGTAAGFTLSEMPSEQSYNVNLSGLIGDPGTISDAQGYSTIPAVVDSQNKALALTFSSKSGHGQEALTQPDQTAVSLSYNTTKDPFWNTISILLRLGSHSLMVMHLLVAASLKSPVISPDDDRNPELSAEEHFQIGSQLLADGLKDQENPPTSVCVLAAFYFTYLYRCNSEDADTLEIQKLSRSTADYVHRYHVLDLCSRKSVPPSGVGEVLSWSNRTLLARLMVWLFYADILVDFRNQGGYLARYLYENQATSEQIFSISRTVLLANWGSIYPVEHMVDDIETSMAFELLFEVHMLLQRVNGCCPDSNNGIEEDFGEVQGRFSGLFRLATTECSPRPRLFQVADYVVSYFYAARIYYEWYKLPRSLTSHPQSTGGILEALLGILYRSFSRERPRHRKFQWPFLIAGAETSDPIQRDWILHQMSPDIFKLALTRITLFENRQGSRPDVLWIRNLFSNLDDMAAKGL